MSPLQWLSIFLLLLFLIFFVVFCFSGLLLLLFCTIIFVPFLLPFHFTTLFILFFILYFLCAQLQFGNDERESERENNKNGCGKKKYYLKRDTIVVTDIILKIGGD